MRQAFRDALDVDTVLQPVDRGTATRAWGVVGPASPFGGVDEVFRRPRHEYTRALLDAVPTLGPHFVGRNR